MNITTKFNLKDTVFFINASKVTEATIFSIKINEIETDNYIIEYTIINKHKEWYKNISNGEYFKEEWLFSSKEELIKSL